MSNQLEAVSPGAFVPFLPPELERSIFELACADPGNTGLAYQLTFVARRVRIWIEPLLYRVVVLGYRSSNIFLRTISSKPSSFFATNVHSLCLSSAIMAADDMVQILGACSGITNLACWTSVHEPDILITALLSCKSLTRLSIDLSQLFRNGPDFAHPLFANLTHLELLDRCHAWDWEGFERLPKLTHLALDFWSVGDAIVPGLKETLELYPQLQMLLFVRISYAGDVAEIEAIGDARIAVVFSRDLIKDWANGASGGLDIWARGAAALEAKRIESTKILGR